MTNKTKSPFKDADAVARRLLAIAKEVEPVRGKIPLDLIEVFIFRDQGSKTEFSTGLEILIEQKLLLLHDNGSFVELPDTALLPLDESSPGAKEESR